MTEWRTALEAAFDEQTKETPPSGESEKEGGSPEDTQEPVRTSEAPEGAAPKPEGDDKPEDSVGDGDKGDTKPADRARDPATGKFLKGSQPKPDGDAVVPTEPEKPKEQPQDTITPIKPPTSWKLGAREHWAKLPRPVQEEVNRRELEIQQELTRTGKTRQFAEEFYRTIAPYAGLIQAQNATPLQAVDNLMRTAAGLTMGTAQQKAQIVTNIIKQYGVDVKVLDQVLSGAGVSSESAALEQMLNARLKPVNDFIGSVTRARQTQNTELEQEVAGELQAFQADEKNEFYNDVRMIMADLMDAAHNAGQKLTLQQAYSRACDLHPEVAAIVKQRKDAADALKAQADAAAIAKSKAASSSVRGTPKTKADGTPMTRRDVIANAWEEASSS